MMAVALPPCSVCGFDDWPEGGMHAARSIHMRGHDRDKITKTPLIIITRDRAGYLSQCLKSLIPFEDLDIHIVDHGSTWPAMIEQLEWYEADAPVHRLGDRWPRDLWSWDGLVGIVGEDRPYLVTDPDVVLDPGCPGDWLEEMRRHLGGAGEVKVGLGLRIDDLPGYGRTPFDDVRAWESAFWQHRAGERAWHAPVDTTLALYPPLSRQREFKLGPAIRLDAPYLLRHLPWYEEGPESEELAYYRAHALPGATHWASPNPWTA